MSEYRREDSTRSVCRYGRVFFNLRRQFALTASEALLADVIDTLSQRTGWSFAGKRYLASTLGVSERSLVRMLKKLVDAELVERKSGRGLELRAGSRWTRARTLDAPAKRPQST